MSTRRTKNNKVASDEAFAEHAQQDAALSAAPSDDESPKQSMSIIGKLFVFLVFPTMVGVIGLYIAYLETRKDPVRKLSFDQDFMMPFLFALAITVVIGFQTGGYTGKFKPLLSWPKVRRVKKVIRKKKKHAEIEGEEKEEDKDLSDKKND